MKYGVVILLHFLCHSSTKTAQAAHSNPYRRNLELLLQEPSSGAYTKNAAAAVEELWITQKLDHFDEHNNQTWQMRYLRNAKYHVEQGPMYIFVGGEWTITPGLMSTGLTHDMAVENAGMLYYTEHRYYGQSWPMGNNRLTELKFLSLRQALADLAHFIEYQKSQFSNLTHSKVILVGGSYSGSMVAWMTRLYPKLITASWASSAPLLAKADFYEYMEMVSNAIELSSGNNCSQRIELGLQHLAKLLDDAEESTKLLKRFNFCKAYNATDVFDRAALFNGIGNYFALIVQSYSVYIPRLCTTLMSLHANDEEALLLFLELLYATELRASECFNFGYQSMLQLFADTSDFSSGTRAWFYQTCNEFGWYTTTQYSQSERQRTNSFANQVPLLYFERLCRDAFGESQTSEQLARGIALTNAQFDGKDFNHSLRYQQVLFTHGELDPWRALGYQQFIIPGYSHVEDMASIDVKDSIAMNLMKLRVMAFIRRRLIKPRPN